MALQRPVISFVDGTTFAPISKLQYSSQEGTVSAVVADTESVVAHVGIANNFVLGTPASEAVMDATDCQLKITATDGSNNSPVVKERWIHAKCVSAGDNDYVRLGLDADGQTEIKLNISAGDASKPNTIAGGANDGTKDNAGYNVATVDMFAKPDLNTEANGGLQQFRTVLIYSYGAE